MNLGTANPAGTANTRAAVFNGPGTAYPIWGTGNVFHLQAGYLLPSRWTRGFGRLQPYGQISHASFQRLNDTYTLPEAGINWILAGQNAKITLHYRPRPLFSAATGTDLLGGMERVGHRQEVIMQSFIYF
jgi:hypothetical protein